MQIFKIAMILFSLNPLISCSPTVHAPDGMPISDQSSGEQEQFVGTWVEVLLGSDGDRYTFLPDGQVDNSPENAQIARAWHYHDNRLSLTVEQADGTFISVEYMIENIDADRMAITPVGEDWPRIFRRE